MFKTKIIHPLVGIDKKWFIYLATKYHNLLPQKMIKLLINNLILLIFHHF